MIRPILRAHWLWPVVLFLLLFAIGCGDARSPDSRDTGKIDSRVSTDSHAENRPVVEFTERDAEIVRFVLEKDEHLRDGRIYFLTITPFDRWGDHGAWADFPEWFHESISGLHVKYRPASEAYLDDESVLEKETDAPCWMRWITIKRWISETEVEIDEGVWGGPLWGGGSISTYEMVDGEWQLKSTVADWVS